MAGRRGEIPAPERSLQTPLPAGRPPRCAGHPEAAASGSAWLAAALLGWLQFYSDAPARERDLLFANRVRRGLWCCLYVIERLTAQAQLGVSVGARPRVAGPCFSSPDPWNGASPAAEVAGEAQAPTGARPGFWGC